MRLHAITLILFVALLAPIANATAQNNPLNAYQYLTVQTLYYDNNEADIYGISALLRKYFQTMGIAVLAENEESWPGPARENPCLVLHCQITAPKRVVGRKKVTVTVKNCNDQVVFENSGFGNAPTYQAAYQYATKYALEDLLKLPYAFNAASALPPPVAEVSATQIDEASASQYLATLTNPGIEGIYQTSAPQPQTKMFLRRASNGYELIMLEAADGLWKTGELRASLQPTTIPNIYRIVWAGQLKQPFNTIGLYQQNTLSIEVMNAEGQPFKLDLQQKVK